VDEMSQEIWDKRWMDMTYMVASWSKDRSRKIGSVIVDDKNILVSIGWNGFPRGLNDNIDSRHQRPIKYKFSVHAEMNSLLNKHGHSLQGCKLYVSWYPCANCAQAIIQSGIKEIIAIEPNWNDPTYKEDFAVTREMFEEVGIFVRYYDAPPPSRNDKYFLEEHKEHKCPVEEAYHLKSSKKKVNLFITAAMSILKKISVL
jgi:dCMP deaminase